MALNDDLIKKILAKLNDVYPKDIEKMKEILPDYEDQEEVCLHLFHPFPFTFNITDSYAFITTLLFG